MPRTGQQFEDMRAKSNREILDASLTLFARTGFAATTVDAIARQAGISKGLIYRHYSSKDDLFEAVLVKRLDFLDSMIQAAQHLADPYSRLERLVGLTIEDAISDLRFYRIFFATLLQPEAVPSVAKLFRKLRFRMDRIDAQLLKVMEALGAPDPERELVYCRACVNGFIVAFMQTQDPGLLRGMGDLFLARYRNLLEGRSSG